MPAISHLKLINHLLSLFDYHRFPKRRDLKNDRIVLDGIDAEFWIQKLLNKVYRYYEKNGFAVHQGLIAVV